jgi:hypothetical protein
MTNSVPNAGFVRFYGQYWSKSLVDWKTETLLGCPDGWIGRGKIAADQDRAEFQMNFWGQKGVYILYESNLTPVYVGQAGLERANSPDGGGGSLGARLSRHYYGGYRNGWSLFSWFGFLETKQLKLREAGQAARMNPSWKFGAGASPSLNEILASFEAVLIEGFTPRLNSRGGDLGSAWYVDQYERDL